MADVDLGNLLCHIRLDSGQFIAQSLTVQNSLKGLATRFLAIAGISGIGYMVKSQMEAIDATAKMADRLGMATEALVGLQHAAKASGVDQGILNNSLRIFTRELGNAQAGSKSAKENFTQLGISFNDLIKMRPEEAVGAVADKINTLGNQSQKTAAAMSLFGRGSQQLLTTFKDGSKGLAAMREEAERLGISFSRLDAAKVELANDAFYRMKESFRGVFVQMMPQIAPFIEAFNNGLTDAMTNGDGVANTFRNNFYPAVKGLTLGLAYMNDGLSGIKIAFLGIQYGGLVALITLAKALASVENTLESFNNTVAKTWAGKKLGFEVIPPSPMNAAFIKSLEEDAIQLKTKIAEIITAPLSQDEVEKWFAGLDAIIAKTQKAAEEAIATTESTIKTINTKITTESSETASQRTQMLIQMYEDMGIHDKRYKDAQVVLLDMQKIDYANFINDKILLDAWYQKRKEDLDKNAIDKWVETYSNMGNVWDGLAEDSAAGLDSLASAMTNFYKTGEIGWKSWLESLYTSYLDTINKMIIANIAKGAINPLLNAVGAGLGSLFSGATTPNTGVGIEPHGGGVIDYNTTDFANGGALNRGNIIPMAGGMVLDRPTLFPMGKGNVGLAGEAGPELGFFPLTKKGGKLGISGEQSEWNSQRPQNIYFNITTPDTDSFRRSKTQIANDLRKISG